MNVKTFIAETLRAEGVEFVSCFPENPLIDAFAAAGVRPVICRSERVVVNVADGFSRMAGRDRFGVAVMQYGPGIENAFAGLAQAFADSVPVLVMPGRYSRRQAISEPDFDAVSNLRGVTKWAAQVSLADRAPVLLRRAVAMLRNGRGGPVLLEVPTDVANEEFDADRVPYASSAIHRSAPAQEDVERAIDTLLESQTPMILAGQGIHWSRAWAQLREFAELMAIPVATTVNGKSSFPEDHPLSLGTGGMSTTGMLADYLPNVDTILAVGTSLRKWWMAADLPRNATIIHATLDERDLNKDYIARQAMFGDARLTLAALTEAASRRLGESGVRPNEARASIARSRDEWLAIWGPKLQSDELPLNPYRVIAELARYLDPETTIVTHESGNPREQAVPFIVSRPRSYVGWGHSSQLGYSLGIAMGLKLARPERDVFNIMGDAAFGMTGLDLETAVRNQIGIVTVVLNNSAMGNYETHMPIAVRRYQAKRLSGNYAEIASSLGALGQRVTHPGEFDAAFTKAIQSARDGRPALLEFITREEPAVAGYKTVHSSTRRVH